jgi:hypothetical protein
MQAFGLDNFMKHWPLFTKGMAEVALISMASVKIGMAFSHSPEIQKCINKPIKNRKESLTLQ